MTDDLDHVGRIQAQWRRERPDLDPSPMGIIGRLHRLARVLEEELAVVMRAHDLSAGEFDVLATLRRAGAPYELSPGELAASMMVTTGATSKRIDRCEEKGWLVRRVSDADGRGRQIALTEQGLTHVDRVVGAHLANEGRLVGLLPDGDRAELARLLEAWGRALGA